MHNLCTYILYCPYDRSGDILLKPLRQGRLGVCVLYAGVCATLPADSYVFVHLYVHVIAGMWDRPGAFWMLFAPLYFPIESKGNWRNVYVWAVNFIFIAPMIGVAIFY